MSAPFTNDGSRPAGQWSPTTAPPPPPGAAVWSAQAPPPPPGAAALRPPRTNGLAIASLVLGILGFGLLPVIFGHIALGQIRRNGEQGRGMAIAGLVLGWLVLASTVVAIVLVVLAVGGGLTIAGLSGAFS